MTGKRVRASPWGKKREELRRYPHDLARETCKSDDEFD